MPDTMVYPQISNVGRVSASGVGWMAQRSLAGGESITADFLEALALEGRVFVASAGAVTTPLTFLTTAANRPDAWLRVPANTTILPLSVNIVLESMTGTVTEIDLRLAQNDIGNGTSTAMTVGPVSTRTSAPIVSTVTPRILATGDTTAETNPVSLYRKTYIRADDAGGEPPGAIITRAMMGYPVVVGAGTLELYIAATTNQATGFVVFTWAELPSSVLS